MLVDLLPKSTAVNVAFKFLRHSGFVEQAFGGEILLICGWAEHPHRQIRRAFEARGAYLGGLLPGRQIR
jgi:hypothetical protein